MAFPRPLLALDLPGAAHAAIAHPQNGGRGPAGPSRSPRPFFRAFPIARRAEANPPRRAELWACRQARDTLLLGLAGRQRFSDWPLGKLRQGEDQWSVVGRYLGGHHGPR